MVKPWWHVPFFVLFFLHGPSAFAATQLTEKQSEALRKYVGRTYWLAGEEAQKPLFFSSPDSIAASFRPQTKESFEILELARGSHGPGYKVRFSSGKEGYISTESFFEELNVTILTYDPDREQKIKAAKESREEEKREAWIRAQPWPEHIKEAALKKQAVLGMNTAEAKVALGKPARVIKLKHNNQVLGQQEQWIYERGPVLTFTNGVVTRIQSPGQ